MFDEMKETLWSIILACLIGAFCGLIVAQFLPNRENVIMAIFIGIIATLCLLVVYYFFLWRAEVRKEKKRERINRRSGFSR